VFAELVCRSNFSFLRGASHPEDLVFTAAREGHYALALTDGDGLYGVVKAHLAAKQLNVKLLIGSQLTLTDAPSMVVYAQDLEGYRNLSRVISESRLSHPKGEAGVPWQFLAQHARGLIALLLGGSTSEPRGCFARMTPSAGLEPNNWRRSSALRSVHTTTSTPTRESVSPCKTS
jgi:error-prone DNA polymerase